MPGPVEDLTDADGVRLTCFGAGTANRTIAELRLSYWPSAPAVDRIRGRAFKLSAEPAPVRQLRFVNAAPLVFAAA